MFNKKQILVFLALFLAVGTTYASDVVVSIDGIDIIDNQNLSVGLSTQLDGISSESDAKVLEDIKVISSVKDENNAKKITLQLESDLVDDNNYSIISISEGLNNSMDFNLSGDKSKILNSILTGTGVGIEYISVIDSKTIEIYLNNETTLNTFDFKVFKEISKESMFLDTMDVNIKLSSKLLEQKEYILILTLKDLENNDIEIENGLYDFVTDVFALEETVEDTSVDDFSAAKEESISGSGETIENVAMAVKQTPDTGTKTNILLFLTFVLTFVLILIRKKEVKV